MVLFNPSTFIAPYLSTDKVIQFKNSDGGFESAISIFKYKSFAQKENILEILAECNIKFRFEFDNSDQAKVAATNLNTTLTTLIPNIKVGVTAPPVSTSVINQTVAGFNSLINTNSLAINTIYEITDSGNIFGLNGIGVVSPVYRVSPYKNNQTVFDAIETNTNIKLVLEFGTNVVRYAEKFGDWKIEGPTSAITLTGTNTNLTSNISTVTANNTSKVEIYNSNVNLNTVTNSKFYNCNGLILANCNNVMFEDITGDFSAYSFNNVAVSKKTVTKYKADTQYTIPNTVSQQITAFIDSQNILIPASLANDVTLTLINPFDSLSIETEFTFVVQDGIGNRRITILNGNNANALLATFTAEDAGSTFSIRYQNGIRDSTVVEIKIKILSRTISVSTQGQTVFPNILAGETRTPANSTLFINGVGYLYGYHYEISGRNVIVNPTNLGFDISTTDKVWVNIY